MTTETIFNSMDVLALRH